MRDSRRLLLATPLTQADFEKPTRPRRRPRLIAVWDVMVAAMAFAVVMAGHQVDILRTTDFGAHLIAAAAFLVLGPLSIYALRGYETATRPLGNAPLDWMRLMFAAATTMWVTTIAFGWWGLTLHPPSLTAAWVLLGTGWFTGRCISRARLEHSPQNALVVGTGRSAQHVVDVIARHPEHGLRVVGLIGDRRDEELEGLPPVVGAVSELAYLMTNGNVKRVIVADAGESDQQLLDVLRLCTPAVGVRVQVVPRLAELVDHDSVIDALGGLALVEISPMRPAMMRSVAKRAVDIAAAAIGLVVLSPVLAGVALAIRINSPGPAFFRQVRIGRYGREFRILKFRTMYCDADSHGLAAQIAEADRTGVAVDIASASALMKEEDDPRITGVGRFLRKTSLDELPQLWNVLKGDMSIVGPRPLRPYEVATLNEWQQHRHSVRPGITGSWQVLGRSDITWEERMHMDYTYARNHSLRHDLRILARTTAVVFGGKGAR